MDEAQLALFVDWRVFANDKNVIGVAQNWNNELLEHGVRWQNHRHRGPLFSCIINK